MELYGGEDEHGNDKEEQNFKQHPSSLRCEREQEV
jgi:hypothetical protein